MMMKNDTDSLGPPKEWIQEGFKDAHIDWVESFTQKLVKVGFTKTAMRNFFNEVKNIESMGIESAWEEFSLLRIKIVWLKAKSMEENRKDDDGKLFADSFLQIHSFVRRESPTDFYRFVKVLEAVLAYHKLASMEQVRENSSKRQHRNSQPNRRNKSHNKRKYNGNR